MVAAQLVNAVPHTDAKFYAASYVMNRMGPHILPTRVPSR